MKGYHFRLFVAGRGPRSERAVANLDRLCRRWMGEVCRYDVVDVMARPELAEAHDVLATPTLVLAQPAPQRRVVGDLSDMEQVVRRLDLQDDVVQPRDGA